MNIETFVTLLVLYLLFQVLIGTFIRLMGQDQPKQSDLYVGRKTYIRMLISGFGVLYSIFCVLRLAFRK